MPNPARLPSCLTADFASFHPSPFRFPSLPSIFPVYKPPASASTCFSLPHLFILSHLLLFNVSMISHQSRKPSTSPMNGKLAHQARATKEITEIDMHTTGWDSSYSTKPLRTNPPHWGDIPNRAPSGWLEQWIWRKRLWFESTFILIVLEPWEKLLVCE